MLLDGLGHSDADVRQAAAEAISFSRFAVDQELPQLLVALKDDNPKVRVAILGTMGQMVPPRRDVIEVMARMLTDEAVQVRRTAGVVLREQARYAPPALP